MGPGPANIWAVDPMIWALGPCQRNSEQRRPKQGARPLDFGEFVDLMSARVGEHDSKEDVGKVTVPANIPTWDI